MGVINWYDPVAEAYREIAFDDAVLMLRTLGFSVEEAEKQLTTRRVGKPLPIIKKGRRVFGIFRSAK